ncbi:hypothetical protein DSCO28_50400 [Desulfosarcina ovata subsp. sediminis]|uniref:Uncharacterized protein n=1 Tax=Desulfosarcina ovata subsp. sediminis TaxID=885957 RepID=A0A5K7ZWB9_9BACT|nr:hypothetical protein [Desulfosarcina ovata]BBO80168.1 hypothetical protein DSCO28_07340 [Desulfosarcina ovata subsp. sediminis]BBO84474.1 hypothetical protein DSCO28_50400 [Desulfosarcina ovata subsp. sediminis]
MDLKDLKMRSGLDAWATFKGVKLKLAYVDKPSLEAIVDKARVREWNRKHKMTEKVDEKRLIKGLAGLILDWELTLGQLAQLMPVDAAGQDPATVIPCKIDNAVFLVRGAYGLDDFIIETVTDLAQFVDERRAGEVSD